MVYLLFRLHSITVFLFFHLHFMYITNKTYCKTSATHVYDLLLLTKPKMSQVSINDERIELPDII